MDDYTPKNTASAAEQKAVDWLVSVIENEGIQSYPLKLEVAKALIASRNNSVTASSTPLTR